MVLGLGDFFHLTHSPYTKAKHALAHVHTSPAPPLEDQDLLQEILLRLPPQPSSLPRVSLVCKRWRSILSDPHFLKRFRKHHRKPPLLGFFQGDHYRTDHVFAPILHTRFAMPRFFHLPDSSWTFMDCRHGLAVLISRSRRETVVWDPLTGQQHHANFPPRLDIRTFMCSWHATVLRVDAEDGHVHEDCFSSPFKLVLICSEFKQSFACFYESASGEWGNVVSTATTHKICSNMLSVLVGNVLYWFLMGGDILAFDFDERHRFYVIEKPADPHITNYRSAQLLRTEDGGLGLAVLSELAIKLWERKSYSDGVVGWVLLQKTIPLEGVFPRIPLEKVFPWRMNSSDKTVHLVGYDEETNVIVLSAMIGNFMLQLDSGQIRHMIKRNNMSYDTFYPYTNFYTAERCHVKNSPQ